MILNRTRRAVPRGMYLVSLLAISILGLGLRLYQLDADSLWVDEIYTATTSRLDFLAIPHYVATTGESHPPLLYMLTKAFSSLVGTSDFAVRLPAALLGSLSLLLAYKLGEMLWSEKEGLAAAFLLAINAYHVQYSQEARHYAPMVFLALLSSIFLLQALRRNQWAIWLGFALATSLNLYLHYFAFLVLPAQLLLAAWIIMENRPQHTYHVARRFPGAVPPLASTNVSTDEPAPDRENEDVPHRPLPRRAELLRHLVPSVLLVALLYLPWLPRMWQQLVGAQINFQGLAIGAGRLASPPIQFAHDVLTTYSGVAGAAFLLYLMLFVLGLATSSRKYIVFALAWILAPFVFSSLVKAAHPLRPKYAIGVLPIYLLTIARGIAFSSRLVARCSLRAQWSRYLPPASALAMVLLFGVLSVPPLRAYYAQAKEDWRDAAEYLATNMAPGDVFIADGQSYLSGGDATRTLRGLVYYLPLYDQDTKVLRAQRGLATKIQDCPRDDAAAWGVLWHAAELDHLDDLGPDFQIVQFPFVTVLHLREPEASLGENVVSTLHALLLIQPFVPSRFDLHVALAEIYSAMGESEEAAYQGRLAAEVAEEVETRFHPEPNSTNRGWDWKPYWDLGSTYENLGMLREAAGAYEEVLRRDPSLVQAYLRLSTAYCQLQEPAKAVDTCRQGVDNEPENPQLHLLLGDTYLRLGRIQEATLAYREVLRIDPTDTRAQTMLRLLSHATREDIPHPLPRNLNLEVALLGFDVHQARVEPGETLDVTLWWQALTCMNRDYTVFIHLTGPQGRIWAQEDRLLLRDDLPTSAWQVGWVVQDQYHVPLPCDVKPGEYAVTIGVYYWETGQRLPMWDGQFRRDPGDAIVLRAISVTPPSAGPDELAEKSALLLRRQASDP